MSLDTPGFVSTPLVEMSDRSRTFPNLPNLLNNTTSVTEELPSRNRIMKFRATVRDNRVGGGGVNSDDMQVSVVNTGTPSRSIIHPSGADGRDHFTSNHGAGFC